MTPMCLVARADPCHAGHASTKRTITPPYAGSTLRNRHGSARLDAQKGYAGTPTIRNARSLLFPFRSPGAMEGGSVRRRASTASSRGERTSGARHDGASVSGCRGWGRLGNGPRHTSTASFLGPHKIRDGRRASYRGAAFDLRCRSCQATSSITNSLPLNEIASPARLPSNWRGSGPGWRCP